MSKLKAAAGGAHAGGAAAVRSSRNHRLYAAEPPQALYRPSAATRAANCQVCAQICLPMLSLAYTHVLAVPTIDCVQHSAAASEEPTPECVVD